MSIGAICNRQIPIVAKTTSVAAAAKLMNVFGEHALLVTDEKDGKLLAAGILTERDIVCGIVAKGADASALPVEAILSSEFGCVKENTSVFDAIRLMYEKSLKQAVVFDEMGGLVGIATTDHLFESMAREFIDFSTLVLNRPASLRNRMPRSKKRGRDHSAVVSDPPLRSAR